MNDVRIDTKTAIGLAKNWITEQFAEEGVEDVGLEEVKFADGCWEITIGFSRPWDRKGITSLVGPSLLRSYKVIVIKDETGEVVAMRTRQAA